MRPALLLVALVAAATVGSGVAGATPSSGCSSALEQLREQRGEQVGLRAAYEISVKQGWVGHVARLGPRMIDGEAETTRLLLAMYGACS